MADIYETALRLLTRREHSKIELKHKLRLRSFSDAEINPILDRLKNEGYQSDDRFTESYIQMRITKGYGPYRIRPELKQRGISDELINEKLNTFDEEFWQAQSKLTFQKKFGPNPAKDPRSRAKQNLFMKNRGQVLPCAPFSL